MTILTSTNPTKAELTELLSSSSQVSPPPSAPSRSSSPNAKKTMTKTRLLTNLQIYVSPANLAHTNKSTNHPPLLIQIAQQLYDPFHAHQKLRNQKLPVQLGVCTFCLYSIRFLQYSPVHSLQPIVPFPHSHSRFLPHLPLLVFRRYSQYRPCTLPCSTVLELSW